MKLTVAKRIAYVILGSLACFVLVFNPIIAEWWNPKVMTDLGMVPGLILESAPAREQAPINWWTTSIIPGVLYIGKRFVDWFFDNVMPTRSTS